MKKSLLPVFISLSCLFVVTQTSNAQKAPHLNHIAVYVKSLPVMTAFYQKIVGLDTIPEPFHDGRHTWFAVAEHSHLHLIQGAAEVVAHDKNSHLCFSVESMEDFIKVLQKFNVPYEAWNGTKNSVTTRVDGVKQIYFQDPENYWVEINNDKY